MLTESIDGVQAVITAVEETKSARIELYDFPAQRGNLFYHNFLDIG